MKETGIIFSTDMVKAILNGTKTQTRRVIKPQPFIVIDGAPLVIREAKPDEFPIQRDEIKCPYGSVGDNLWVRETFWQDRRDKMICFEADHTYMLHPDDNEIMRNKYIGTANENMLSLQTNPHWKKKPSIFMPRWASRITLEITEVRVERVQDMTLGDVKAEGMTTSEGQNIVYGLFDNFEKLWDSLNAKRGFGWDPNPWVFVISFNHGVRVK